MRKVPPASQIISARSGPREVAVRERSSAGASVFVMSGCTRVRLGREAAHDLDQLAVCGALRITKFADRVRVGKLAEPDQFAYPLPAVQWQFRRPAGEQEVPQFALAEQMAELACRHIDQKQHQNPELDRDKAVPGKCRYLVL